MTRVREYPGKGPILAVWIGNVRFELRPDGQPVDPALNQRAPRRRRNPSKALSLDDLEPDHVGFESDAFDCFAAQTCTDDSAAYGAICHEMAGQNPFGDDLINFG
jgi:hypothetical protein